MCCRYSSGYCWAFPPLCMIAMPGIVWLLARDYQDVPGKFELSVTLSRITFPYLGLVSLVAMLSGVLNARSRFAPGAFVPVLLNIVLIAGIVTAMSCARHMAGGDARSPMPGGGAVPRRDRATRLHVVGDAQGGRSPGAPRAALHARSQAPGHADPARPLSARDLPDQPAGRHLLRHLACRRARSPCSNTPTD